MPLEESFLHPFQILGCITCTAVISSICPSYSLKMLCDLASSNNDYTIVKSLSKGYVGTSMHVFLFIMTAGMLYNSLLVSKIMHLAQKWWVSDTNSDII